MSASYYLCSIIAFLGDNSMVEMFLIRSFVWSSCGLVAITNTRYTHAHQVPHVEHMEWQSSEALVRRRCAVLPPPIRVSERSKSLGWWRTSCFLSSLSCLSSFCWAASRLPYIWTRSGVVFYLPSPRSRFPRHRTMVSWAARAKRYVNYA